MHADKLRPGLVVYVAAGKEQGGFYMVTEVGEGYVTLADGKRRPLEKPKRKNLRHIRLTDTQWEPEGMTNRALRSKLRDYTAAKTDQAFDQAFNKGGNGFV